MLFIWYLFYFYQKIKIKNDNTIKEKLGISSFTETQKLHNYMLFCQKHQIKPKVLWFHAESLGESFSVISLIKKLYNLNYFIIFTTNTYICKEALKEKLKNKIAIQYFPYPNHFFLNRFYQTWKYFGVFFIENAIYPTALSFSKKHHIKNYLLNARISNTSFNKWKIFKYLAKKILCKYDYILPSSTIEEKKFKFLCNSANIEFIGNLKISSATLNSGHIKQEFINQDIQDDVIAKCKLIKQCCENRRIIVFGSIHKEEFFYLVWQYIMLSKKLNLIAIFAPRYLSEMNQLIDILKKNNITTTKWSEYCCNTADNVIIVDRIGDLYKIYNICDIAVVGGSFVNNIGGHNPLEPISLNKLTFIGKYVDKCSNVVELLLEQNAIIQTDNLYFDVLSIFKNITLKQQIIKNGTEFLTKNSNIENIVIQKLELNK